MQEVTTDEQAKLNFAANLARIMRARGVTQVQLASRTGVTQATISTILSAKHLTNIGLAKRIAEALDTSVDLLAGPPPEEISTGAA